MEERAAGKAVAMVESSGGATVGEVRAAAARVEAPGGATVGY